MDHGAALAAFDSQLRNVVHPPLGGWRFERVGPVVRCVSARGWSGVEWSGLDDHTADAVIAEQLGFFRSQNRTVEWKYYSYDTPADLPDRLRAAGFTAGEEEALMIADLVDVPVDLAPPAGVRIVTVTDPGGLEAVRAVHEAAFGGDYAAEVAEIADRMRANPESLTLVLALAADEPVCAARVEFHTGTEYASLWGGGTVAAWRGRGIYRAMVAYRARLASQRGYRYLRIDALPPSRPILEKLGFARLAVTVPFTA